VKLFRILRVRMPKFSGAMKVGGAIAQLSHFAPKVAKWYIQAWKANMRGQWVRHLR